MPGTDPAVVHAAAMLHDEKGTLRGAVTEVTVRDTTVTINNINDINDTFFTFGLPGRH